MNKKNYEIVDSTEKLEKAIEKVRQAQKQFASFTQEQVDIVHNTTIIYRVLFVVSTGKRCCLHTTSDTAKIIYNVNSAPSSINNPSKAKTA